MARRAPGEAGRGVTERPILFSGPMVRAILEGRKTQTRRVVAPLSKRFPVVNLRLVGGRVNPEYSGRHDDPMSWGWPYAEDGAHAPIGSWLEWCPYGRAGDRLWVRETFCGPVLHSTDGQLVELYHYRASEEQPRNHRGEVIQWTPSIHMPRVACRLVLEVTGVRVERLQDISRDDAIAEGLTKEIGQIETWWLNGLDTCGHFLSPAECYRWLWDSLNAKRGFGWAVNPWVWVVEFRRVDVAREAEQLASFTS
jgi:hypothetical protein